MSGKDVRGCDYIIHYITYREDILVPIFCGYDCLVYVADRHTGHDLGQHVINPSLKEQLIGWSATKGTDRGVVVNRNSQLSLKLPFRNAYLSMPVTGRHIVLGGSFI